MAQRCNNTIGGRTLANRFERKERKERKRRNHLRENFGKPNFTVTVSFHTLFRRVYTSEDRGSCGPSSFARAGSEIRGREGLRADLDRRAGRSKEIGSPGCRDRDARTERKPKRAWRTSPAK